MLKVTQNLMLPTAITGSYPRPLWFTESLHGRSFKSALGDSIFREQYLDAVACVVNAQEAAGLDIVTDGDTRFDLSVGGKSWFFYPIERLGGVICPVVIHQRVAFRHCLIDGQVAGEWQPDGAADAEIGAVGSAMMPAITSEKIVKKKVGSARSSSADVTGILRKIDCPRSPFSNWPI